jgi:hypothetical protein
MCDNLIWVKKREAVGMNQQFTMAFLCFLPVEATDRRGDFFMAR